MLHKLNESYLSPISLEKNYKKQKQKRARRERANKFPATAGPLLGIKGDDIMQCSTRDTSGSPVIMPASTLLRCLLGVILFGALGEFASLFLNSQKV